MGEFFFYYYEEVSEIKKIKKRRDHLSHISDESEDFVSTKEGVVRPRILEEHRPGEVIYYVELIGVSDKRNIRVELEGNTLKINAYLDRPLKYPSIAGRMLFKEYIGQIELPYIPEKDDISVVFDKDRSVLIIRLRKKRRTVEIKID